MKHRNTKALQLAGLMSLLELNHYVDFFTWRFWCEDPLRAVPHMVPSKIVWL
jgi:hypothetical protein